eukprot:5095685-Lingulodinium_polyedra.AAC.1
MSSLALARRRFRTPRRATDQAEQGVPQCRPQMRPVRTNRSTSCCVARRVKSNRAPELSSKGGAVRSPS